MSFFFYAMWFSDFLQNTPLRPFLESNRKYFISALKNHSGVVTVAWGTTRGGNLFWKGWVRSELFFYKKTFIFIFLRNAKNRASGHNIGPLCYFLYGLIFLYPDPMCLISNELFSMQCKKKNTRIPMKKP